MRRDKEKWPDLDLLFEMLDEIKIDRDCKLPAFNAFLISVDKYAKEHNEDKNEITLAGYAIYMMGIYKEFIEKNDTKKTFTEYITEFALWVKMNFKD